MVKDIIFGILLATVLAWGAFGWYLAIEYLYELVRIYARRTTTDEKVGAVHTERSSTEI